jgi:hypothetical protein
MKRKPKHAGIVEKLDEILKTLKRIEAKPVSAPAWVPYYFYPPYWVQPTSVAYPIFPQITWSNPSITISGSTANVVSGTYIYDASVPFTLTAGNN